MKLRAQIVVDIDAENYVEAAEHQRHLELCLEHIRARYATAQMQFRERRERKENPPPETPFALRNIQVMKEGK